MALVNGDGLGLTDFPFILDGVHSNDSSAATTLLLSDQLDAVLGFTLDKRLNRLVSDGIILFSLNEEGDWHATDTVPTAGLLQILIRADLVDAFENILGQTGTITNKRNSLYSGWIEIDAVPVTALHNVNLGALRDVAVLQETVATPRIALSSGVRMPSGWLGRRAVLPAISVSYPVDRVTIEFQPPSVPVQVHECLADPSRVGYCLFPKPPRFPEHLDGKVAIKGWVGSQVLVKRVTEFRSHCISTDFRVITRPENWIAEGGNTDIGFLNCTARSPSEISETVVRNATQGWRQAPKQHSIVQMTQEVKSLCEILASTFLRRQLIPIGELARLFQDTLGIKDAILWDTIRAWEECGAIESLTNPRWRQKVYRGRQPRLIVSRTVGSHYCVAVVQGLTPTCIEESIALAAARHGSTVSQISPQSTLVPAPLILCSRDNSTMESVSHNAGLAPLEFLLPIESCLSSIAKVMSRASEPRANHQMFRDWDWKYGFFSDNPINDSIKVLWHRRDDVPDSFVVEKNRSFSWHTLSRVWALLAGASLRNSRPFKAGVAAELTRDLPGLHLPLVVGRWATASSGLAPAPPSGSRNYTYYFQDVESRDRVSSLLWPNAIPMALSSEGRRLGQLLRNRGNGDALVPIPPSVCKVLRGHAQASGLNDLSRYVVAPKRVLPRLMLYARKLEATHESWRHSDQ